VIVLVAATLVAYCWMGMESWHTIKGNFNLPFRILGQASSRDLGVVITCEIRL